MRDGVDPREITADSNAVRVVEIFHSIQGESSLAGERFSFIRLSGCPLRCSYCDTAYAFSGGSWMTVNEILEQIEKHETRSILVTGGEPLIHRGTLSLVQALNLARKRVSIETSGEENVEPYVGLAKLVMDIKTPGSGEKAKLAFSNLAYLLSTDEIKFVICDRSDYEWARKICQEYGLEQRFTVFFSPSFGKLAIRDLAEWVLQDKMDVRLQLQLHKQIWPNETRGV